MLYSVYNKSLGKYEIYKSEFRNFNYFVKSGRDPGLGYAPQELQRNLPYEKTLTGTSETPKGIIVESKKLSFWLILEAAIIVLLTKYLLSSNKRKKNND